MKAHLPRLIGFVGLWLLGCLAASAFDQAGFVGKTSCSRCHAQQERTLADTPHDGEKACESCHGPGKSHVKAPNDPSTIFRYKSATPGDIRLRCGACHSNPLMQRHAVGDVSCTSCHSSHHYVKKKYLLKSDDALVHDAMKKPPFKMPAR
jgi:hypothetical protein